jgi:hypothetical protein
LPILSEFETAAVVSTLPIIVTLFNELANDDALLKIKLLYADPLIVLLSPIIVLVAPLDECVLLFPTIFMTSPILNKIVHRY